MNELLELILSSINDEWLATFSYEVHKSLLRGLHRNGLGDVFEEHAEEEEEHAERLTQHLHARGVDVKVKIPQFEMGSTTEEMLKVDLTLEIAAIDKYNKIIQLCENNPELKDTQILIEDILNDEIHHADELAALLRTQIKEKEINVKSASMIITMKKIANQMDELGQIHIADKYDECIKLLAAK